ncbi:winged helix-turn-helix domain-containing protein [Catellatospora sichuanensis]|uniref:winged helix-turn-helix domain-containing protein n=1 Tax=Catellatospora sichuanensis TaxID=1969805 RepID=UPI0011834EDF|nr:winged helix-turn-helix domain-containing protein [Catellatospora sichuanensis]
MLRLHFTAADLGSLRLASGADPLWETLLSQHALTSGHGPPALGPWRRHAMTRLTPAMRALLSLAPPTGYSPDFLTPTRGLHDVDESLDAGLAEVLATPIDHLRTDLRRVLPRHCPRARTERLADGDRAAMAALAAAMRSYFEAVLAGHWELISGQVAGARARGARFMVDGGVDRLLTTLHPTIRWDPPTLHVAYPEDRDIHLAGRGLVLLPSYFCRGTPVTLRATDRPPVLVYPIDHDPDWDAERTPPPGGELVALLGNTRAAVLRAAQLHPHGCTTTELARRVRISLSSASEHATTLRRAGLLRTRPYGRHMLHVVTPLGRALLTGRPGPPQSW